MKTFKEFVNEASGKYELTDETIKAGPYGFITKSQTFLI